MTQLELIDAVLIPLALIGLFTVGGWLFPPVINLCVSAKPHDKEGSHG